MYFSSVPPHEAITSDIASKYVRSSARSRSGSSRSPSSVEPITSAKRIVATLRSSLQLGPSQRAADSGQRGRRRFLDRRRRRRLCCKLQRRVLVQYLALELLERRARLDPDLLDERLPPALEDLQRVRLPSAAIEGEHQLGAGTLTERRSGDERLQLGDELVVAAERQIGVEPIVERTLGAALRSGRSRSERRPRSGGRPTAPRARARAPRAGDSSAPRDRVAAAPPRSASRTGPDRPRSAGTCSR